MKFVRLSSLSSSSSTFSLTTPKTKSLQNNQNPFFLSLTPNSISSPRNFSPKMSLSSLSSSPKSQTIEHIVLFNVKDNTEQTKINSMINGLNSLTSLDQVLYLTVGPILRNKSSSFNFTHLLHSRYKSKEDLKIYSAHPNHQSVVKESVLPICNDVMAVDWVSNHIEEPIKIESGSVLRLTLLKLKEDLGEIEKGKVLDVIGGIKNRFDSIKLISFGENFSPARAKGFSIGSIAVFPGLEELESMDANEEEEVKEEKKKVKGLLESVIVLDYVV